VVLHYYSPEKSYYLPFTANFEFGDGINISNNYFSIYIIVGLVICSCIFLSFLNRCSKIFSKTNPNNSNNSSRINQPVAIFNNQQRIHDLLDEREELQNRVILREEKKKKKNTEALEKLFNDELKTEFYKDKADKEFTKCTICLDDYSSDSEVITLMCKHTFHYTCMRDWLSRIILHPKCPNCNDNILNLPEESSESDIYSDSEGSDSINGNIYQNRNGRNISYQNLNGNRNNRLNNSNINRNINRNFTRTTIDRNNNALNRTEIIVTNNRSEILNRTRTNNNTIAYVNNNVNENEGNNNNVRNSINIVNVQNNRNLNNVNNNSLRRGRSDGFNNITTISIDGRSLNNGDNFDLDSNSNPIVTHRRENNMRNTGNRYDTNNYVLSPDYNQNERS